MYYVYVLYSKHLNILYKGSTADLKQRFNQHNKGEVRSTKKGIPWLLIYYEAFLSKTEALREELFLKSGEGKERLRYLFNDTLER